MKDNWQIVYDDLIDYVFKHPEIDMRKNRVILPNKFHSNFYRLFDEVTSEFIKAEFNSLVEDVAALRQYYFQAEKEIIELLDLDSVLLEDNIERFLYKPIDCINKIMLNPLFDLLQQKIGIDTFREISIEEIQTSYSSYYCSIYKKWALFSLMKLLKADRLYQVDIPKLAKMYAGSKGIYYVDITGLIPNPTEVKKLSFRCEDKEHFQVPEIIIHSQEINAYVAMKSQLGKAVSIATNKNENREWFTYDLPFNNISNLTLIYIANELDEISLVSDNRAICRPDLLLESWEHDTWYRKQGFVQVKLHHERLNPLYGTYVISETRLPIYPCNNNILTQSIERPMQKHEHNILSGELPIEKTSLTLSRDNKEVIESKKSLSSIDFITTSFNVLNLEPIVQVIKNK